MLIEAARRAEAAAKEMLALLNGGAASCSEAHEMLAVSKTTVAIMLAAQTSAAKVIAGVERHGDGGAQVLADTTGLSRRDAHSQVKTARTIEAAPSVRAAVEEGRVSPANARRLAEAIEKTSAEAVESDTELLAGAQSMRPEQFTKEARRWATDRQADGGEADYQRLRTRRCVRVWDTDDGMVALRGEFDPVAGRRIGNRLQAEARRLYDIDKKQASSDSERRSFQQCMADALDNLTANNASGNGKPFADICVVAHVDDETGELIAELPDGGRLPQSVLEEFACNAKFTGVVYDRMGKPIWRAHSVRTATEAQRQILMARYGGCFHCAAHPALCQIHHIRPVSQGGSTRLDNMVPACWDCHQKIHHHNWQIRTTNGVHTLHPPGRVYHGPARAHEDPLLHLPSIAQAPDPVPPRPRNRTAEANETTAKHLPGIAQAPDPVPPRPRNRTAEANKTTAKHLPGIAQAPDPVPPRLRNRTTATPATQARHLPDTGRAPDIPSPKPHSSRPEPPSVRSGPAAARAALRNVGATAAGAQDPLMAVSPEG